MQLAIVYNPEDNKLGPDSYSWTYRDMLQAVIERFSPVQMITRDCNAAEIEAEAILFWDIHSSHHIKIHGIEQHSAVKVEYFNDPHQLEQRGTYSSTGKQFHKLGPRQRTERAAERGVRHIICPYRAGYNQYIHPHALGIDHWHLPIAPANRRRSPSVLGIRKPEVLISGHLWEGRDGFRPYEFRRWAWGQESLTQADHSLAGQTPSGPYYQGYLARYAGALAACDCYVVPKYLEIPLAGCVCFCQMLPEYAELGFEDGVNCIAVDRQNLSDRVMDFLADPTRYQAIADAGRRLAAEHYTCAHFAQWLENQLVKNEVLHAQTIA